MSRPLVVVRPEPGLSATVAEAEKLGLSVVAEPLFAIEPRSWEAPDPAPIDGLLVGSANAIRHAGIGLAAFVSKPVYAVGQSTAQAAREFGLTIAETGEGGLQQLLDRLAGVRLTLLRLAGEEHVALAPPKGIRLVTRIVYASVPQPLPQALATTLQAGSLVALHSAAAAHHFVNECVRLGLNRSRIALVALGPRIAEVAGEGWRTVESASEPTDAALLALARRMCHAAP